MDGLTRLIIEHPLATLFGSLGLTCQLVWPWFRTRRVILSIQLAVSILYCSQYALLAAFSAAAVCGLGATQTFLALAAAERPWMRHAGFAFLPIAAVLCLATWTGLPSLFALFAVTLGMLGRLQQDVLRLRTFQLGSLPFAIGHDMLVGAIPALVGGLLSACIGGAALIRELRLRSHTPAFA